MRRNLYTLLALVGLILVADSCEAAERWTRVAEVASVDVTVTEVTLGELAEAMGLRDARPLLKKQRQDLGHAVLRRNVRTGAYTCTVYVLAGAGELTLEHELRHCNGWTHE